MLLRNTLEGIYRNYQLSLDPKMYFLHNCTPVSVIFLFWTDYNCIHASILTKALLFLTRLFSVQLKLCEISAQRNVGKSPNIYRYRIYILMRDKQHNSLMPAEVSCREISRSLAMTHFVHVSQSSSLITVHRTDVQNQDGRCVWLFRLQYIILWSIWCLMLFKRSFKKSIQSPR
jgi:hypothetical protein